MSGKGSRRDVLKWFLAAGIAAVCLALDLVTKAWARNNLVIGERSRLFAFLDFQRTANKGVAFGMFSRGGTLVVVAVIVALVIVILYLRSERRVWFGGVSGGILMGGSLGNLVERVQGHGVTDFLKLPHWPNFNLADVFILIGVGLLMIGLLLTLFSSAPNGRASNGRASGGKSATKRR